MDSRILIIYHCFWRFNMDKNQTLVYCLKREQNVVNLVLTFFSTKLDFNKVVYTEWTAKDVLAHIVLWHESFANNIMSIVNDEEPNLLKGLGTEINENGVKEFRKYSIEKLKEKLAVAQEKINKNIKNNKIKLIPYREGVKRKFTREEHLDIVYRHIKRHLIGIIKMIV